MRLTCFAPRRRASSSGGPAERLADPVATRLVVDDDVFDPRLEPGRDAIERERQAADDPAVEPRHEQDGVGRVDDLGQLVGGRGR